MKKFIHNEFIDGYLSCLDIKEFRNMLDKTIYFILLKKASNSFKWYYTDVKGEKENVIFSAWNH